MGILWVCNNVDFQSTICDMLKIVRIIWRKYVATSSLVWWKLDLDNYPKIAEFVPVGEYLSK